MKIKISKEWFKKMADKEADLEIGAGIPPPGAQIKKPRLFYYEDTQDCWAPAPDQLEQIIQTDNFGWDGETITIEFKRVDMTDEEYENIPEG